ncbi:MAG: hypothetical protein CO139_03370 [Candidatus Moranbacteria bacterium CG_4_9_14_3_um_filter_36_9]|nr:MAG: hypothetical protein CO139_03370 [Candidatus Moranbacteria bacterium CG_4_9_14_3_um_filter_36_9]
MKILEINKFNYRKGGTESHFLELVQLLKSHGHEVAVFSMENKKNDFSPWKKYFVSYVGYNKGDTLIQKINGLCRMFYSIEARQKIKKLLNDFQPDIVHIHNIYHQISPSILTEIKKRGIPIVMTVHDYKIISPNYLMTWPDGTLQKPSELTFWNFVLGKGFKNSYRDSLLVFLETQWHRWLKIYEKNIDLYISPSNFAKEKLVAGGIPENKITVLPHFFPENKYSEKMAIDIPERYVFYFGRLAKNKGVEEVIEIFKNRKNCRLYMAGEKEADLEIPKTENIKYLGWLRERELDRYIKNSLFVVSTSRLPEVFGLVALESIKNGKPFVAYNSGAYSEIITHNRNGFLGQTKAELQSFIDTLEEDEGLRILFSRNALKDADNFKADNYYKKLTKIFEKLKGLDFSNKG